MFLRQLNAAQYSAKRVEVTVQALAEAKGALIGDAISRISLGDSAYLRLPDVGQTEGVAALNFVGNAKDLSVLGKFPWKTLRTEALRDGDSECLWYIVSGRYKIAPKTDALNWDTAGQIDVIDGNGNIVAGGLAALVVAPGSPLDEQNRALSGPGHIQCGGNYDARNYLDAHSAANALSGEVNYFAGSSDGRVAATEDTKRFVASRSGHYNDHFIHVTVDDIFRPLVRRSDFAAAVAHLLSHPALATLTISGPKGTDNLSCGTDEFCKNWKEMLFITQLPSPATVTIDGTPSSVCNRIAIFGGRRINGQDRSTAAQKASVSNYLEGSNAASFNTPTANAVNFSGASTFDWHTPGTDVIRCVP